MAGGGSEEDFSSLPVYNDQADLDYAVRTGQIGSGDRARIGNSIYMYEHDAGWQRIRTLPPGTFADDTTGSTPGILNPLPDPVTGGILNPSPTGGITDPNYKSLGEYLVGPTYTGPTTADEYVMQRAGGPAWDYSYPMYLGAGVYGPGGSIPTVTSGGVLTGPTTGPTTTPITDTTIDTTTDTTTTTTTDDDDTIIIEGPEDREGRVGPEYGWGPGQTDPIFPNTWPGIVNYNQRVEDMGSTAAFGLLDGLRRTNQSLVDPSAPYASPLSPENFNPLSLGGAGDPGWAPESTIQQEVWDEAGTHKSFKSFDQFTQEELGRYGWKSYSDIPDNLGSGMMIDVQHHQGQTKGSSFLGMLQNTVAKTEGSKPSESIAAMVDALTPQQQKMEVIQTVTPTTPQQPTQASIQAQQTLDALKPAAQSIFSPQATPVGAGPSQHEVNVQAVQAQVAASQAAAQAIRDQQAAAAAIVARYSGFDDPHSRMSQEESQQIFAAERAARESGDALGWGGGGFVGDPVDPVTGFGGGLYT